MLLHLLHLLQFFFAPPGQPWYAGAVWGNVVAIIPCGVLGWLWSKTRFWPLNYLEHRVHELHARHDELHQKIDELHAKHDALQQALAGVTGPETSNLGE